MKKCNDGYIANQSSKLRAYLLQSKDIRALTFYDANGLPAEKADIRRELHAAILATKDQTDKRALRLGLLRLAQFQTGVGPVPLTHPGLINLEPKLQMRY